MGFFRRPKILKDSRYYIRWPYILDAQEGMSFNPIRPQGCLHYVGLGVFWFLFLGIVFGVAQAGWYLFLEAWTYLTHSLANFEPGTVILGIIVLGLAGSATLLASAALGDSDEGTAKGRRAKNYEAYKRVGRGRSKNRTSR